jgi:hypothetical protein
MYKKVFIAILLFSVLGANEVSQKVEDTANLVVDKMTQDDIIVSVIHSDFGWGVSTELPYLHSITNIDNLPLIVSFSYLSDKSLGFDVGIRNYHTNSLFGLFYGFGFQTIISTSFIPHVDIGYRTLIRKNIYLDASLNNGYDIVIEKIYSNVTTAVSYRF